MPIISKINKTNEKIIFKYFLNSIILHIVGQERRNIIVLVYLLITRIDERTKKKNTKLIAISII